MPLRANEIKVPNLSPVEIPFFLLLPLGSSSFLPSFFPSFFLFLATTLGDNGVLVKPKHLATVQVVTFPLQVMGLFEEGCRINLLENGLVGQKDGGNKATEGRRAKEQMDKKEELVSSSWIYFIRLGSTTGDRIINISHKERRTP